MPHPPQFLGSELVFTSQPLAAFRSQSAWSGGQPAKQDPFTHSSLVAHPWPQDAQCAESVRKFEQVLEQQCQPAGHPVSSEHLAIHTWPWHMVPIAQSASVVQFVHWCVAGSQVWPVWQSASAAQPTAQRSSVAQ
jgi:hypothetical protein